MEEQGLPTQPRIGHFIQMYSADASDKDVLHETKQGLKKKTNSRPTFYLIFVYLAF